MKITTIYKIRRPIETNWIEIDSLFMQLKRELIPVYNKAALAIYERLMHPREHEGKPEGINIEQWSTDMVYHPAYAVCQSSIISLGIKSKLSSSYGGGRAKDVKNGIARPPFIDQTDFPITFYKQNKFRFTSDEDGIYIDIPLPKYKKLTEIDKYKPWIRYELVGGQEHIHFQLVESPKDKNNILKRLLSGDIKSSTIEIKRKRSNWYIHLVVDIPDTKQSLDPNKVAEIEFAYDRPIIITIPGKTLKIKKNEAEALVKKELGRIRGMSVQSGLRKTGRGTKKKFTKIKTVKHKYIERRKKLLEHWVALVDKWIINNNIGSVVIKSVDQQSKQKSLIERLYFPAAEIESRLINRLKQTGVKIKQG